MSRLWAVQRLGATTLGDTDARVDALARVLRADAFYAVRAAAATSLGDIGIERAKSALLSAWQRQDSRVRTAAIDALGNFSKDSTVYRVLVDALHNDSSYAVEAAAAKQLGKAGAFDVLQAEARAEPELHVMQATLAGLVATKDPRAAEILLAHARPGVPERIRLSALAGLESMKGTQDVVDVVRAALHDPFYPVQEAGEGLVGAFGLTQFEPDIRAEADSAPMSLQRTPAQQVLEQLHHRR